MFLTLHHRCAELHCQSHIASDFDSAVHERHLRIQLAAGHLLCVFGFHRQCGLWGGWTFSLTEVDTKTPLAPIRQVGEGELEEPLDFLEPLNARFGQLTLVIS
jgi:hypothetical protein